ncbi:MAG: hypothetical protein ACPG9I_05220 [Crocinitomicaceae bacterium]
MNLLFDIQTIKFNSLSDWLILNGKLTQGSLNSELFLKVDQSFLNKILNRIQRANPDTSINDFLKTNEDIHIKDYEFDFTSLMKTCVPMSELKFLTTFNEYKFIRA